MTSYQINYHAPTSGGCESSTYVGATVKVRGYVSAVDNNGFYMQDSPTSAPYEGMFVYTTSGGGWLIGRAVGQIIGEEAVDREPFRPDKYGRRTPEIRTVEFAGERRRHQYYFESWRRI